MTLRNELLDCAILKQQECQSLMNQKPEDDYLPVVHDATDCYKEGGYLCIYEPTNDNAWISGKPISVTR